MSCENIQSMCKSYWYITTEVWNIYIDGQIEIVSIVKSPPPNNNTEDGHFPHK